MEKIKNYSRGFTLIELLLYVSILGSLLISVTLFFNLTSEARIKSSVINGVNGQASYVMDYVTTTIRGASTITAPLATVSAASLTLTVPTSANSPTVFSLVSGAIMVKKGTAAATALTGSSVTASNLAFTNLTKSGTNGIIQVSFTLASSNTTGRAEYNYSKTFTSSAEVGW